MPRSLPQHDLARRSLVEDKPRRGWVLNGVVAAGISVLGLGIAGTLTMTGTAQNATGQVLTTPSVTAPAAFDRRSAAVSRSVVRPSVSAAAFGAGQRVEQLFAADLNDHQAAQAEAALLRAKDLATVAAATKKKGTKLEAASQRADDRRADIKRAAKKKALTEGSSGSTYSLPITSGFHIAARFGDTGSWARYHTGLDFAAPMGTTIHAAAAGVVTHAGSGSAGWAGHYVAIKHADGKSTLYAHMSTVSVHVGEKVSGGERIGAVGMTGRSFGPHVHFELYPAGVKPGDLYHAVNPAPWLHAHGLHF